MSKATREAATRRRKARGVVPTRRVRRQAVAVGLLCRMLRMI